MSDLQYLDDQYIKTEMEENTHCSFLQSHSTFIYNQPVSRKIHAS